MSKLPTRQRRLTTIRPRPAPSPVAPEPEPTSAQANPRPSKARSGVRSAAIGALAAAIFTGMLGYFGVYQQIKAEDTRVVKEQQLVVYSALISDERALRRVEEDFFSMFAARRPAAELTAQKKLLDEAFLKLSQDTSNVALVGSGSAAVEAFSIESNHLAIKSEASRIEFASTNNFDHELDQPGSELEYDYLGEGGSNITLNNLINGFLYYARRDLGTE